VSRGSEASLLQVAEQVVAAAQRAGAEQCDVFAVAAEESSLTVRRGELEKLIEAGSRSLSLRVITGGRTALCSSSDLRRDALERLVGEAVALAAISEPDECAGLPDPALLATVGAGALQLYDERIASLPPGERVRLATACEAAAFAADPRIDNSDGATFATHIGEVALANSLGFAAAYPATAASLAVEVMASDTGGKKRNAHWYSVERSLHRLQPPEEVGRIAARRAVDQLGARKVETREAPVVCEPMMTAALLRDIASAATGGALYRGATFLAGRVGEGIGSPLVSIVDDPVAPGRPGSRPFDGEGVATRRTPLFEAGSFCGFLFDCYTARRTGHATTGSAQRGIETLPAPGPSNLVFEAGTMPPEDIVAGVEQGLYLTTLLGFGFNPATGDFSRGAAGFWIEGGRIAFPVTEINISGRLDQMLASVDAAGSDLAWFGTVAAPTVRIARMTISGL
jgi:PmbA protein